MRLYYAEWKKVHSDRRNPSYGVQLQMWASDILNRGAYIDLQADFPEMMARIIALGQLAGASNEAIIEELRSAHQVRAGWEASMANGVQSSSSLTAYRAPSGSLPGSVNGNGQQGVQPTGGMERMRTIQENMPTAQEDLASAIRSQATAMWGVRVAQVRNPEKGIQQFLVFISRGTRHSY